MCVGGCLFRYKTIIGAAAATGVRCMSHIEVEEWQKKQNKTWKAWEQLSLDIDMRWTLGGGCLNTINLRS